MNCPTANSICPCFPNYTIHNNIIYMGRTSKIKVLNKAPEIDTTWLMAAISMGLEEKITILQAKVKQSKHRHGQNFTALIQAGNQSLEEILEIINIFDHRLIIFMMDRQSKCFNCGLKSYIRAKCQPAKENEKKNIRGRTKDDRHRKTEWK